MARSKSKKKRIQMELQQKHKAYHKRHKVSKTKPAGEAKTKPAAKKKTAK